jgi:hypothetical protein
MENQQRIENLEQEFYRLRSEFIAENQRLRDESSRTTKELLDLIAGLEYDVSRLRQANAELEERAAPKNYEGPEDYQRLIDQGLNRRGFNADQFSLRYARAAGQVCNCHQGDPRGHIHREDRIVKDPVLGYESLDERRERLPGVFLTDEMHYHDRIEDSAHDDMVNEYENAARARRLPQGGAPVPPRIAYASYRRGRPSEGPPMQVAGVGRRAAAITEVNDMRMTEWLASRDLSYKSARQNTYLAQLRLGTIPVILPAAQTFLAIEADSGRPIKIDMTLTSDPFKYHLDNTSVQYIKYGSIVSGPGADGRQTYGGVAQPDFNLYVDYNLTGGDPKSRYWGILDDSLYYSKMNQASRAYPENIYLTVCSGHTIQEQSASLAIFLLLGGARDFCISSGVIAESAEPDALPDPVMADEMASKISILSPDPKHPLIFPSGTATETEEAFRGLTNKGFTYCTQNTLAIIGLARYDAYMIENLLEAILVSYGYSVTEVKLQRVVEQMDKPMEDFSGWALKDHINKLRDLQAKVIEYTKAKDTDLIFQGIKSYINTLNKGTGHLPPFSNITKGLEDFVLKYSRKGKPSYYKPVFEPPNSENYVMEGEEWYLPGAWQAFMLLMNSELGNAYFGNQKSWGTNLNKIYQSGPGFYKMPSKEQITSFLTILKNAVVAPSMVSNLGHPDADLITRTTNLFKTNLGDLGDTVPKEVDTIRKAMDELSKVVAAADIKQHPGVVPVVSKRSRKMETRTKLATILAGSSMRSMSEAPPMAAPLSSAPTSFLGGAVPRAPRPESSGPTPMGPPAPFPLAFSPAVEGQRPAAPSGSSLFTFSSGS